MAAGEPATTSDWLRPTLPRACCALPMDRTKFIATRVPGWSCASTRIRSLESGLPLAWFLEAASLYAPHEGICSLVLVRSVPLCFKDWLLMDDRFWRKAAIPNVGCVRCG